ncbi:MAG: HAD family phosphatase [Candidatus Staskawiczbacteria bacterium]|nr:HAD family phosphatase [Candidatus Staskawiczbacteria bacterium]
MIKVVLFDYGGIIKVGHPLSMDLARICNVPEKELEQIKEKKSEIAVLAEKGIITDEEFWKRLSEAIGKPLPADCAKTAKDIYRKTFVFIQETVDLVKKLRAMGIRVVVLSNIFKFEADVIRENKGYDEFEDVILSYEVGMKKPEMDIYQLAVEKLKVKPEECIFIDDKEKNLLPAKELGMKTVLAKNPAQIREDVLHLLDRKN